jgi:hypothetical protein
MNSDRDLTNIYEETSVLQSSDYYETSDLSNLNYCNSNLNILHVNIRGMANKTDVVLEFLEKMKNEKYEIDVLVMCETFMNSTNIEDCKLCGFKMEYNYRTLKTQSGVAVYVNEKLEYNSRNDLGVFHEGVMECCFVELITEKNRKNIIIGEVYRVPGTDENFFLEEYNNILHNIGKENKDLIIGTDQNLDYLKSETHVNTAKMLDINLEYFMIPTITKPTRITHSSATLIDNIYISKNLQSEYKSAILVESLSDHLPCLTLIKRVNKLYRAPSYITCRQNNEKTQKPINNILLDMDWRYLDNYGTNEAYEIFHEQLYNVINEVSPVKQIKIKPKNTLLQPWMTSGLLKSSNKINKLYKKAIGCSKSSREYAKYIKYRNKYHIIKRNAKKSYFITKFIQYKRDRKKTWNLLNQSLGKIRNKQDVPNTMINNGNKTYNIKNISNQFCKFFTDVGPKLAAEIDQSDKHYTEYFNNLHKEIPNSMYFIPTDPVEIVKIINKLQNKSSTGHDMISNNLLKGIKEGISFPLSIIFNKSISEGRIPNKLKFAEIKPIYKGKKSKSDYTNYRPISLLPCISKILEKIVYTRLSDFLEKHKILDENQYGFRASRSTTDAVTNLLGHILNDKEKNNIAIGLFIDYSKAFDTIDYDTLLYQMEKYGIRGLTLEWFRNYLTGRTQRVKIVNGKGDKATSDTLMVTHGVPQGSILGPLLFLLYVNDLNKQLKNAITISFADDTTIYVSDSCIEDVYIKLYDNILILIDWSKANKLSLNLTKTNYMLFQPKKKKNEFNIPDIIVDSNRINRVKSLKFLGICLDENLNWTEHINQVSSRLKQNCYLLNNVKYFLPKKHLLALYYAHIYSHIIYGISIWGPLSTSTQLDKIYREQKKALRYITNESFRANYNGLGK